MLRSKHISCSDTFAKNVTSPLGGCVLISEQSGVGTHDTALITEVRADDSNFFSSFQSLPLSDSEGVELLGQTSALFQRTGGTEHEC